MNSYRSLTVAILAFGFSLTAKCAPVNADPYDPYDPYYSDPSGQYDPYSRPHPGYGYGGDYRRDRDDYERERILRERRELEYERNRLNQERDNLEQDRRDEERRRREEEYQQQQQEDEARRREQQERERPKPEVCPSGFSPSEQKCTPEERKRGCKDIRLPGGLGCVRR